MLRIRFMVKLMYLVCGFNCIGTSSRAASTQYARLLLSPPIHWHFDGQKADVGRIRIMDTMNRIHNSILWMGMILCADGVLRLLSLSSRCCWCCCCNGGQSMDVRRHRICLDCCIYFILSFEINDHTFENYDENVSLPKYLFSKALLDFLCCCSFYESL